MAFQLFLSGPSEKILFRALPIAFLAHYDAPPLENRLRDQRADRRAAVRDRAYPMVGRDRISDRAFGGVIKIIIASLF